MPDTILSNRWKVYYEAENRQKRIERDTSVTPTVTDSVNGLYSALQDLFDELTQLDDGSPMSAQTPTEYTIGIIDTGDDDPWYIDNTSVEYLTGGAIQTSSWTRSVGSNTGIVVIQYTTGTDFATSDIGKTVSSTEGDSGTLLDFNSTGTVNYAWIRPDDSTATHNWDSATGTITVTGGSAASVTQSAAAVTGEDLWSNINTIGTIADNTHIYVQQGVIDEGTDAGSLLTAAKASTDWWGDGQIDILIKVKESDVEIDEGVVTVFARQLTKSYSYFSSDLTNGGRTAIPLGTGTDLNAQEGVRQTVVTTASGDFTVGEVIDGPTAAVQGVVTSVSGTSPNLTIQYYLIGDPLTDFTNGDTMTGADSGETATVVTPTDVNSGALATTSITHAANTTFDVDENDTNESYSIVIDCANEALLDVYQWAQYTTRRGGTTTTDTDGIEGQFYIGIDYVLEYSGSVSGGSITEGNQVTQANTGAKGIVVGHDTTNKIITIRNSRGTFNTSDTVTDSVASGSITPDTGATAVSPNAAAPFGTFAGGTWFLARSIVLNNVLASEAQNFVTTTADGQTVNPPNKVQVAVANTRDEDRVAVFELTAAGGIIDKGQYTVSGTNNAGGTTVTVGGGTKYSSGIATDTVGKTTGGVLFIVDDDADVEYRIKFASWTGSTFTLGNTALTPEVGTNTTNITDTGAFTTANIGDLVYNSTQNAYAYIVAIVDANNATISPAITGQSDTDTITLNVLPVNLTATNDTIFVPLVHAYEGTGTDGTPGTESATVTYVSDIPVLVIARNSNSTASATTPMLPYSASATVSSTGLTNNIIRSLDSIKT